MGTARRAGDQPPNTCADCRGVANVYNYSTAAEQLERDITVFVRSVGINVAVTSRLRTCCEQAALYRAGKTTALPMSSQHEFGFAFDLVPRSGFQQYRATFPMAVAWLVALARHFGGDGLAESDHAHIQVYSNDVWRRMVAARDIGAMLPIPGRRPRSR